MFASDAAEQFIAVVKQKLEATPPTPLLSASVLRSLTESVKTLCAAGAEVVTGGRSVSAPGYRFENTLLRVPGVRDGAVVVTERPDRTRRLVAFYTAPQPLEVDILRERLRGTPPAYMVPAAFH